MGSLISKFWSNWYASFLAITAEFKV